MKLGMKYEKWVQYNHLSLAFRCKTSIVTKGVLWQFVIYVQIMRKIRIHSKVEGRKTVESYMYCNVTTVGMG